MDLHLGKIIKRLRAEQSVTQEELAEYLGISFQAVSKWEMNKYAPTADKLDLMAEMLGLSLFEKDGTRLVSYFSGQRVKRAQTIDSGPMMNPFSPAAMAASITRTGSFSFLAASSAAAEATSGCKAPPVPCQVPSGSSPEHGDIQNDRPRRWRSLSFW